MSIDEQIKQLIEAQLAPLQSRISALESPSVDYATPPNTGALKKFAMRVSADGKTVRTSAFIAELERRISSDWTQRNARNKSQGEMSNLILEPSPGVRHALVQDLSKNGLPCPLNRQQRRFKDQTSQTPATARQRASF